MNNNSTNQSDKQPFDLHTIYHQAREEWMKREAPRRSVGDWLALITPWFIIVAGVVAYALSAPHTAAVFDLLTPGRGAIAPILVECVLVYLSFQRKQLERVGMKLAWWLMLLEALMFITAVLTNFTGALVSVVNSLGLSALSGGEVLARLGTFPATDQAALVMVVVMALIIPIAAEVAGYEIANLVFVARGGDVRELRWRDVQVKVVFQTIYNIYVQRGADPHEAQSKAKQLVRGYFEQLPEPSAKALSAGSDEVSATPIREQSAVAKKGGGVSKADVFAYIDQHPEALSFSIGQLRKALDENGIHAGRTLVGDALRERKRQ